MNRYAQHPLGAAGVVFDQPETPTIGMLARLGIFAPAELILFKAWLVIDPPKILELSEAK